MRCTLTWPSRVFRERLACPPADHILVKVLRRLFTSPQLECSMMVVTVSPPVWPSWFRLFLKIKYLVEEQL